MTGTYTNPVYDQSFPDPFVLKYCGTYWAYCTGFWDDGRVFGILHSPDLVNWREVGSALDPLPSDHPCYWAPEVTYDNGRFFLYYSVGNEKTMHIRVATAAHPAGPFVDSGHQLTDAPFAIDPHVWIEEDGRRYLFYATDFLNHTHIGTGTVVDRLLDPYTLAGQPRPVTRACYDWQVYDPQRVEKGGVRWHTLEGPFVLRHKGRYYQMFSGGNWQNESYGVGYATTETLETAEEWAQACDGQAVLPIMRTVPGRVIGPGHNSVVRGPDNRQLYCVYHRWSKRKAATGDGRVLAIDPLDWAGERMVVLGPSFEPQPAPLMPTVSVAQAASSYTVSVGVPYFVAEVSLRAIGEAADGRFGLCLAHNDQNALRVYLQPATNQLLLFWESEAGEEARPLTLPADFDFQAYHLLRLEVDGRRVSLLLDEKRVRWQGKTAVAATEITLVAEQVEATFAGLEVTVGWEELFTDGMAGGELGWHYEATEEWHVRDQELVCTGEGKAWKGPLLESYEFVVNARLIENGRYGCYGFLPVMTAGSPGLLLIVEAKENGWVLVAQDQALSQQFSLPDHFDPTRYQQFRFRKADGRLSLSWEGYPLGHLPVTGEPTRVGLYGRAAAAFDLVRVTTI